MCDYSLMGIPNRLAKDGEDLVVHRFPTNTIGMAAPADVAASCPPAQRATFWEGLKKIFGTPKLALVPAICIPPGAQLILQEIPLHLQQALTINSIEEVTFTQLSASASAHRDAVRFHNGTELLLQKLSEGQRVKVLHVDPEMENEQTRRDVMDTRSV